MSTQVQPASQDAERLRAERALRSLDKTEEGTDVHKLPNGVYGFTTSPAFREIPLFATTRFQAFEIHRLKTGSIHILGFVRPEEKPRIDAKAEPVDIRLFPEAYAEATTFVSLDLSALTPAKKAITREDGNPFRTTVHPS